MTAKELARAEREEFADFLATLAPPAVGRCHVVCRMVGP